MLLLSASGITAMTHSVAVHCDRQWLTRQTELTLFDVSFSIAVDFHAFFSATSALRLKMDRTAVDFNTRLYVVQKTLNLLSTLECRRSNRHCNVRCTELTQKASNSPAFVELVWSKHRTNVDLSENGKVKHCHLACSQSQRQHNNSAWCSLMTKNVPKRSLHPSVTT